MPESMERLCLIIYFIFTDGHVELDVIFRTYGIVRPAVRLFNFGSL